MAITRTAIVDDDGSGTTGTVLDNAWKQELYNQIDAAAGKLAAPLTMPSLYVPLAPNTYNNYQPAGGAGYVAWILDATGGASNITGIVAEQNTRHLLMNTSGGTITLKLQDPGSSAGNRIVGPGYANYTIGIWGSAWIYYVQAWTVWVVEKA